MISPGCSFTFDGLKQTLLCVAPGIERQLKQVHHLVVNYRTTKDILVVANSILDIAKQAFPGAIEYALPETAVKDLGLRVVTCDWQAAMQTSVRFGENQVFIYSPCDSDTLLEDANKWLNGHPFILSSLDSKGLEFDDVVVAFDIDRKLWDISRKVEASLRMLRELYVAVTRAQRRVVILVKKDNKNMKGFFESLNCEEINAATIFEEFDHETTKEQWFARGMSLYSGDHFKLAVGCFTRAEHHGWAFLANGKESLRIGLGSEAEDHFRRAARFFHEEQETEKILDILKQLVDMSSKWDAADDELFTAAFSTLPNYLPKRYKVNFHLKRGDWHMIRYSDLADPSLSELFAAFRDDEQLKGIVRKATDEERYQIENVLPWAHADYHIDRGNEFEALKIFIGHEEFIPAMQCSERLLNDGTGRKNPTLCQDIVELWTKRQPVAPRFTGSSNAKTALLLLLFTSPLQAASSSSEQCLKLFGGDVIRAAIKRANLDATTLLLFRDDGLKKEVISTLESRFVPYYTAVVEELVDTGHRGFADEYARHREWVNVDLLRLVLIFRERPKWFLQLLERKLLLGAATWLVLFNDKLTDGNKEQYRSNYKSCFCREITKPVELNPFASHFLSLWKREMFLELLFVYSHVGLWHMAVEASLAALESHSRATRNVSTVLRILDDFVKHDSTISLRSQKILLGLSKIGNARRDDNIVISEDEELSKENPALALSPEWLAEAVCLSDADIDFGCLVLEYGIVAATYSRCVYQYHDQRLIQLISDHFVALKTRFESRMEIQRPAQEIPDNKKSMASNRSSITTVKETKTALIQKDRATGQLVALPNKTVRKNRRVRTRKKKAR